MKKIIFVVVVFLSAQVWAGVEEVVSVKGMVCSFCAQGISKKFKELPEVEKVDVSLEKKTVKLTYKDGQTLSHEKITSVLKEAGYEASFNK